jgi:hypothetical protein
MLFTVSVDAVTVNIAEPLTPLREAVMVVDPAATPVATPVALIVAADLLPETHVAVEVTFPVELSLYLAVAVNCCVAPAATLGVAGVTEIAVTVLAAAVIVSTAVPLTPLRDAVMFVDPAATPVATPVALIVAADLLPDTHVAVDVTFAVELSLYVAVAVNCCVTPTAMLGVAGVTEIPVIVFVAAAVTVRVAVPLTPPCEAVIVDEPVATAVASPTELIVAAALLPDVQVAVEVTFAVEPSLYVAVAVNCCVAPAIMLGLAGVTEIPVTVLAAAVTVKVATPLIPFIEAVTVVEPAASAVASPAELIVATAAFASVHVAVDVTFAVEPSLYVAVAVNCCVAPAVTLSVEGDATMDVSVFPRGGSDEFPLPQPVHTSSRKKERKEPTVEFRKLR